VANIVARLAAFARSPQGQRMISTATQKAQKVARDPRTQEKVRQLKDQVSKRRGGGGPH
jgi:hypothetical protein